MRSYYEATARERIGGILDEGSWREILPPTTRTLSPHLAALELVEYSPRLDPGGRTARVAVELLRAALCGARQQPKVLA